jgi:hypothetical protein
MQPVANAHSTQCGEGRRCHQGHHLPRDQKGSAVGLQAAWRNLRHLPCRAAARVSIGVASVGRRDRAQCRHLPVPGLGRELDLSSVIAGLDPAIHLLCRIDLPHRHPEVRAKRASKGAARIDPLRVGGRSSFEARPLAGHLRMTDNDLHRTMRRRRIRLSWGGEPGSVSFTVTLSRRIRFRLSHRHPEVRAKRASKGDGPDPSVSQGGRSSFEARPLAGHLRITDSYRHVGCCDGISAPS